MKRRARSMSIGSDVESCNRVEHKELKKKETSHKIVKNYLVDFSANTNLHGLRYIGEKDRTIVEKVFWAFIFTCSLILCAVLIRKVYIKWDERPVIVSFDETTTPIWQIPYPAITICFETVIRQSVFNYTRYYHLASNGNSDNFTKEELRKYKDVSTFCEDEYPIDGENANMSETIENIKKMSCDIDELMFCRWKYISQPCSSLFKPILTEEGICYTFNMLGAEDIFRIENLNTDYSYLEFYNRTYNWTLENGYRPNTPLNTYPRRGIGSGAKAGLSFSLTINKTDLDYICNGPGIKIMFHDPSELPRPSQKFFRLPVNQKVVYSIKPKVMTTSESLVSYETSRRRCHFPTKRYLRFFKNYTQDNCEIECLTNYTFLKCGCVHFSMPHAPDMPVCIGRTMCMADAQRELMDIEIYNVISRPSNRNNTKYGIKRPLRCKCIPACASIKYGAETSQEAFDWKELYKAYDLPVDGDEQNLICTVATTFFKEAQFIKSRRSEIYGQYDFLANCGGLLGLCLGFSILSVAEIVYFCTLRLWCLLWKSRRAPKVHSEEVTSCRNNKKEHK